jgi:hypothetical protein
MLANDNYNQLNIFLYPYQFETGFANTGPRYNFFLWSCLLETPVYLTFY